MNRCPDLVVCLKRDLQCLRPEASLVLIYRPNVAGIKGRVDLAQPVNRTPDLCVLPLLSSVSAKASEVRVSSLESDGSEIEISVLPLDARELTDEDEENKNEVNVATRGLLATDHVILNPGQVTWTTPELATPPLLTTTLHQREDVSTVDRLNVHHCPTRRVFSDSGLELVTRQATIRYLYHSATAAYMD
ncbi:uncharacterized protein TNCV_5046901 [Trichonephila clavipes]|nr:uncharacterized protein TNCV_5046901 [Trichonephila clavipes]